jgi:hypothetical protein
MAVPPEFSETEHLQNLIRRYVNKAVRDDFADLGGDDWEPNVTTTRGAMRHGLTHKDNDPFQITLARMFLYYFTFGKARDLQAPSYSIPTTTFQDTFTFAPQIKLVFYQTKQEAGADKDPVDAEITYRIVGETSETMTEAKAKIRANKIKLAFAQPSLFIWNKGKLTVTYLDKAKGYDFRLRVTTEAEGKRIIEQVMDIENNSPDWSNLAVHESKREFPTVTGTHRVYGKTVKLPRRRPVEDIRFRYAELHLWGIPNAITLIDAGGYRRNPLISIS